jgi:hypothetical protein
MRLCEPHTKIKPLSMNARCILVSAVCPELQTRLAEGKDREISPEKSAEIPMLAIMPSHIQTLEM